MPATGPLKLSEIPPTDEAAGENIKRAHHQVAQWKSSMTGIPPDMCPTYYGYDSHAIAMGLILLPQPLPPGTKDAPDKICDMIHCGCEASQCQGHKCKCSSIGCTVVCKCEAGSTCLNLLTKHSTQCDETDKTNQNQTDQEDETEP